MNNKHRKGGALIGLVALFAVLVIQNCQAWAEELKWPKFDKMTKQDIALEATWLTLHTLDYGQTLNIAKEPNKYYEINPILGRHPSEEKVHAYMLTGMIVHPIITYMLPREVDVMGFKVPARTIWQAVSIGTSGALVINNFNIGLRVSF